MKDKIPVLIIYGLLGLLLALAPLLVSSVQVAGGASAIRPLIGRRHAWTAVLSMVVTLLLLSYTRTLTLTPFLFLVLGLSVGAGFLQRDSIGTALQAGAATLLTCSVSATLPWWRRFATHCQES